MLFCACADRIWTNDRGLSETRVYKCAIKFCSCLRYLRCIDAHFTNFVGTVSAAKPLETLALREATDSDAMAAAIAAAHCFGAVALLRCDFFNQLP